MGQRRMGYYCPGNRVGIRMWYMCKMAVLNHVQEVNTRVQLKLRDFCNTLLFPNSVSPNSHRDSPLGEQAGGFVFFCFFGCFLFVCFLITDLFSLPVHEQRAQNTSFKLQDIVTLLHGVRIAASMNTVNKSFNFSVVSNIGTHSRELGNQLY